MEVVKTKLHIGFDAKGQVVRDNHSTDNAKDRAFEFDGIGNRLKSADSLTLPASNNYVANALNQYSTALGVARPAASHDDDGNLVDDGVKTYVWDGENRLLSVSDSSGVLVSYTYDYLSRRISKNETNGSNVTFVYDGWNPIVVYSGSGLSKTYTWGMDLSGTLQGAGGVGGLLAVKEASSGDSYYPTYDGNGNVSEYLDSTGAVVAHYEYDAFGRTVNDTTQNTKNFVHRFSTKQLDEVGLYYYGYRYYQPEVGRWLSRDPIEEGGGLNLYALIGNSAINNFDLLGLELANPIVTRYRLCSCSFPKDLNVMVFGNFKVTCENGAEFKEIDACDLVERYEPVKNTQVFSFGNIGNEMNWNVKSLFPDTMYVWQNAKGIQNNGDDQQMRALALAIMENAIEQELINTLLGDLPSTCKVSDWDIQFQLPAGAINCKCDDVVNDGGGGNFPNPTTGIDPVIIPKS